MKRALFFGLATLDIQYYIDEFPAGNIKVKSDPPEFFIGGPATNAAVAFAALNGRANLITAIGDNSFQSHFEKDFENCQVDVIDLLKNKTVQPVLATVVTSSNGERTIFTHNPAHIEIELPVDELFNQLKPEVLMIDGFYPEQALAFCKEARTRNIPVVFDGGSWKSHLPKLLPFVDFAICSNDFIPPGCKNSETVFQFLNQFNIPNKVITRGGEPLLFQHKKESGFIGISPVDVVDTLGAGDFFHGAFCYYLLKENNFETALQKSVVLASHTCLFRGTRDWITKLT